MISIGIAPVYVHRVCAITTVKHVIMTLANVSIVPTTALAGYVRHAMMVTMETRHCSYVQVTSV